MNNLNSVLDISRYVINYSNAKGYGCSNFKLQKILYFIQAFFLISKEQKPCFSEKIEAWNIGPVVPVAYKEFKQYGSADIPSIKTYIFMNNDNIWDSEIKVFNEDIISTSQKLMINAVVDMFKEYSATEMMNLTCAQLPWRNAYNPYRNEEITINAIYEYYK